MSATDLAREIINQANPPDQPTPFAIRIPIEIHPGYFEHVTITAPVTNGRRVLTIQFPNSKGATTLVYSVDDNLEGAVFCLTSFMLNGDGTTIMEMKPFNTLTGGVDEQFTLARWNVMPNRTTSPRAYVTRDVQEEVQGQVTKIVKTLFCETGDNQAESD